MDEDPVADEPDEDVYEEDGDGVPPEEEGGRPGRQHAQQHALRDRLEDDRHRRRRSVQLPPPAKVKSLLKSLSNMFQVIRFNAHSTKMLGKSPAPIG